MTGNPESVPFDELAETYDSDFSDTMLGRWLRTRVWRDLDAVLADCPRILEVGCGTGDDAIHLAAQGHEVVATDISRAMLEIAQRKASHASLEHVRFLRVAAEDISISLEGTKFSGAFSNFGALNCASNLRHVSAAIARLLEPGAPLLVVMMGRWVPWEWGWFITRLDWRRAFRRLPSDGAVWRGMRIIYPSPARLRREFSREFEMTYCAPLGMILPPSYASAWLEARPRLFRLLTRLETGIDGLPALAGFADHFIMAFSRRPEHDIAEIGHSGHHI